MMQRTENRGRRTAIVIAALWLTVVCSTGFAAAPFSRFAPFQLFQRFVSASGSAVSTGISVSGGTVPGNYLLLDHQFQGKAVYQLEGTTPGDDGISSISWFDTVWTISDDGGNPVYYSTNDVATPDLVPAHAPVVFVIDFADLTVPAADSLVLFRYGDCGLGSKSNSPIIEMDGSLDIGDSYFQPGMTDGNLITCGCFATDPDSPPTKQQCIDKLVAIGGGNIVDLGGLKIRVTVADHIEPLLFGNALAMPGASISTHNAGWYNASDNSAAAITVTTN